MNEQERIMLTIILGKIKNDLERVGDIDKLLKAVNDMDEHTATEIAFKNGYDKGVTDAKSEVQEQKAKIERLQEEANRYKRYFFRHDYDEMIAEVSDELDRFINSNCIEIKDERGIKDMWQAVFTLPLPNSKRNTRRIRHERFTRS